MKKLTAAYGKTVKADCSAEDYFAILNTVGKAGLVTKPIRVRVKDAGKDNHGYCDTSFDENGEAEGHDIVTCCLSKSLLSHEISHAVCNELLTYDELKELNPHGSVYQRCLTIVTKLLEDELGY